MNYSQLNWPRDNKITARTSTIRSTFIRAIIPFIKPNDQEIHVALKELRQDPESLRCVYCGMSATEWDHFRPVVKDKVSTGFITDIYNLVPACGKCNQSKGGSYWKAWMKGKAKHVPLSDPAHEERIRILDEYERWSDERTHRLPDLLRNDDRIGNYMESCEKLVSTFATYQKTADEIKQWIEDQVIPTQPPADLTRP